MKRNRYIFYLIFLFEGMVFYASIATLYRTSVGLNMFQITIIESISLVASLLLEMPWGIVADRIGYKRTIIISTFVYFISKIVFWQADCFGAFLAERLLLSVAIAGLSGCDMGMVYLSCPEGESQKAFGICYNMQVTGMLFAAGIYSLFIGQAYRKAGLFTVISYGIVFLLSFGLKEVPHEKNEEQLPSGKQFISLLSAAIKDKSLLMFLIGTALFIEAHQMVTTFLSQLEYERCGIPADYFGFILMAVTLSGLVSPLSVPFTNRLGRKNGVRVISMMGVIACIVMAVIHKPLLSILSIMVLRVASSLFEPLQNQLQNEKVVSSERATVLSMNAVFMESVGVVVNVAFGPIIDLSLSGAFLLSAILYLAGGLLINKIQK